jgi:hypothetical protein
MGLRCFEVSGWYRFWREMERRRLLEFFFLDVQSFFFWIGYPIATAFLLGHIICSFVFRDKKS